MALPYASPALRSTSDQTGLTLRFAGAVGPPDTREWGGDRLLTSREILAEAGAERGARTTSARSPGCIVRSVCFTAVKQQCMHRAVRALAATSAQHAVAGLAPEIGNRIRASPSPSALTAAKRHSDESA